MTPGRKPSMKMSASAANWRTMATPRVVFRSTIMLRLPRLAMTNDGVMSPNGPSLPLGRIQSPRCGSTLITSAPCCDSSAEA